MIGLTRGKVVLVPHRKEWGDAFLKEKKNLKKILGDHVVAIEHCGSTAIPGIKAKPVIDVLVGVKTVKKEGEKCATLLDNTKGYYSRNKYFPKKDRFVVAKGNEAMRTHYIHIVRYKGTIWNNLFRFRDILKTNKVLAREYSTLKEKLERAHPDERRVYTQKKSVFVRKVLERK